MLCKQTYSKFPFRNFSTFGFSGRTPKAFYRTIFPKKFLLETRSDLCVEGSALFLIPNRFPEAFLGDFLAPLLSAEPGLQSEKSLTSMGRPFGSGMRGTPLPWVRGISGDSSPNLFSDCSLLFCATIFTPARLSCFIRESVRDFSLKFLR